NSANYALGSTTDAMRRLEIQDAQFAQVSEEMLDALALRSDDRVVELGIGAGALGRRIMRRLGPGGVLVGADYTQTFLDQATNNVSGISEAKFEPVLADIRQLGPWLEGADVVVGRTILHHIPLVETFLGTLHGIVRPGTRIGFIEPEFRALLGRLSALEAAGRSDVTPLGIWARGIARYYQACGLSPSIGAGLALTLESAGYRQVCCRFSECPTDRTVIENMLLFYDEVREKYELLDIMTGSEIDRNKQELASLSLVDLPAVWGNYCVTCVT
ncbi:MAG: methyltransferase domain-containing protein, partial [Acidobacteria bacterium]|nr:methyltransferase domain-containing protein [Acidobacteriota bacterium]